MAKELTTIIAGVADLKGLATLEGRIKERNAGSPEVEAAIEAKYAEFGREIVAKKTGLDLSHLSPAEVRIVNATGRYVALQKRDGKNAEYTFRILRNRGLIDAAEATVARSKVTQGFEALDSNQLRSLSFEQIIVDHPSEFSARALWYARRTLGLANGSEKPPADVGTLTQQRTERILDWLADRAGSNGGILRGYSNAQVGAVLGFDDLARHGRVLGNIQSRLDFACYQLRIPPLGLCVDEPFANAWSQEGRAWAFPIASMQAAAQSYDWQPAALEELRRQVRLLPGIAAIPWRSEISERENSVREWAEGLKPLVTAGEVPPEPNGENDQLSELERKLLGRKPAVRDRVSKTIERGGIGTKLKKANNFRCQICDALGQDAIGFLKPNGEPYVEAHHATPVSLLEVGSLSATNIMILCANHHRQMHYGNVALDRADDQFFLMIDGQQISIKRFSVPID